MFLYLYGKTSGFQELTGQVQNEADFGSIQRRPFLQSEKPEKGIRNQLAGMKRRRFN